MSHRILTLNAGSSSVKFALFDAAHGSQPASRLQGQIEGIGSRPRLVARDAQGCTLLESWLQTSGQGISRTGAIRKIVDTVERLGDGARIDLVGHRIAHGGAHRAHPVCIDSAVMDELGALEPLAPLHQPHNLAAVHIAQERLPNSLQVACFDTSFHLGRAFHRDCFALPVSCYERGIRRYGFHGLSYEYIARRFQALSPDDATGRTVVAHLGSGSSLCAMHNGRSVDTTMSFSSLDGVPMGTRCGALDPGVILYLLAHEGMSIDEIETLLYTQSGLLGLSGISNDMRLLRESDDPRARRAIDHFVFRVAQHIAMMSASLGGLDALVFTAGIGENDARLREEVCDMLGWMGVAIDSACNRSLPAPRISTDASQVSVWVIPTDEESVIARHTLSAIVTQ